MPWLPLYIDEYDARKVFCILNSDPEVAFIVSDGPKKWIARKSIESITDGRHSIWHIPSGPLPFLYSDGRPSSTIMHPWQGWTEDKQCVDPGEPFFGPTATGIIMLNIWTHSKWVSCGIGLSSFEWIGNYYRIIGFPAHPTTELWWKNLRRTIKKMAVKRIPRSGPVEGNNPEIWALPSALDKIVNGVDRDDNSSK